MACNGAHSFSNQGVPVEAAAGAMTAPVPETGGAGAGSLDGGSAPPTSGPTDAGALDGGLLDGAPPTEIVDGRSSAEAAEHAPDNAGSAARFDEARVELPSAGLPVLWMVGEGVSPNVWWRDCSQPFASVLENQMAEAVPIARYTFYGNLQAGPVSFVHDLRNMVQLNENTQQRKRLRRVQELPAATVPVPAGTGSV